MWQQVKQWTEYVLVQIFLFIVRICPFRVSSWIGRGLGALAFRLLKSRRELTIENIREARERGFLKVDADDYKVAEMVWKNLGMNGSEFFYYYSLPAHKIRQMITVEGEENLKRILAKGRGAIMVMGHIGNWELIALPLSRAGYKLCPIVKTQTNSLMNKVIDDYRTSVGMRTIPKTGFLRPIIEAFNRNEIVPFLMDQNAGNTGVPLEVFGRVAPIPRGPAEFALKNNRPVFFTYIIREGFRKHRIVISEEIELSRSGDYEVDLRENTARFIGMIQTVIAQYPDQWLWMHKLWPTEIRL